MIQNEKITIYVFPGVLIMLVRVNLASTALLHETLCIFLYSKKFLKRAGNAQFFQVTCEKWTIRIENFQNEKLKNFM